jgi:hypothetical protein
MIPALLVFAVISVFVGLRLLLLAAPHLHGLNLRGAAAVRTLAVSFLACDLAIAASLVTLLVLPERRMPVWIEQRLPFGGRWVWHALLGVTILCYLGLAPTFLIFLIQSRR